MCILDIYYKRIDRSFSKMGNIVVIANISTIIPIGHFQNPFDLYHVLGSLITQLMKR